VEDNEIEDMSSISQILIDIDASEENNNANAMKQYQLTTEYGYLHAVTTLSMLNDHSVFHAVTGIDIFNNKPVIKDVYDRNKSPFLQSHSLMHKAFTLDRYSNQIFQKIIPDTEAAEISTAEISQVHALQ